jgi:hypothetical protein
MKSGNGSQELTRLATAYLTSAVFGIPFLIAVMVGVDGWTALTRGVIAAGIALIAAQFLAPPAIDVVLAALSRDEAKRRAALDEEEEQ